MSSAPASDGSRHPQRMLYGLTALIALVYAVIAVQAGIRVSPDTATYSRWADLLIAHRFDIASYLKEQDFIVPPVLYLGWIVVVALLKSVAGESWMAAVVLLNWISLSAGVGLTLYSVRWLVRSIAAVLLAGALYLVAGDLMIFVPFVLSDLIFWGLSTWVLVMAITLVTAAAGGGRSLLGILAAGTLLAALALAFRPAAMPLAAVWAGAIALHFAGAVALRRLELLLGAATIVALAAIAAHAYVLMRPSAWPFGPLPAMLDLLAAEYRDGVLVYAPGSSLTVAPAHDWIGAIRLTLQKLMYFFTPWLPHYSAAHTGVNLLFFAPAYGLAAAVIANLRRLPPAQQLAAALLLFYVLVLSVFHAMMQIDYDHRYRLPLLPAFVMLAAIGLESVRRPRTPGATARTP